MQFSLRVLGWPVLPTLGTLLLKPFFVGRFWARLAPSSVRSEMELHAIHG